MALLHLIQQRRHQIDRLHFVQAAVLFAFGTGRADCVVDVCCFSHWAGPFMSVSDLAGP